MHAVYIPLHQIAFFFSHQGAQITDVTATLLDLPLPRQEYNVRRRRRFRFLISERGPVGRRRLGELTNRKRKGGQELEEERRPALAGRDKRKRQDQAKRSARVFQVATSAGAIIRGMFPVVFHLSEFSSYCLLCPKSPTDDGNQECALDDMRVYM